LLDTVFLDNIPVQGRVVQTGNETKRLIVSFVEVVGNTRHYLAETNDEAEGHPAAS